MSTALLHENLSGEDCATLPRPAGEPGHAEASPSPEPAQVLELAARAGGTLTPREINDQLTRVLHNYDELTARYARSARQIEDEFARLHAERIGLAGQVREVRGELQRQSSALGTLAGATSADIQTVQKALQDGLLDAEERASVQLLSVNRHVRDEVARLDGGLQALGELLDGQQRNIQQQTERLVQFEIMHELLDTATRGNRKRIEAVREELETQQAVVAAQVQGLSALQREHHAEFVALRSDVGVIVAQIRQLEFGLQHANSRISGHVEQTRRNFRWVFAGVALGLLMAAAGTAAVKWVPAFAPAAMDASLTNIRSELDGLRQEAAVLPALEFRTRAQESELSQVQRSVTALHQNLGELSRRVSQVAPSSTGEMLVAGLSVRQVDWVRQQPALGYTVQLAGTGSQAALAAVISEHAPSLGGYPLGYTVTRPQDQVRYNLFLGSFATSADARAAIEAMPATLREGKPWVRQWRSVQAAVPE